MKKERKFCSIMVKMRLAFLALLAAFLMIIIYILGVQYKNRSIDEIIRQITYEDEILAQSLEAKIQNTKSSVNSIIIYLNEILSSSWLIENGGPNIDTNTQRLIYDSMIKTFINFYDAEQVMIVWNNGVTWYENWTENYSMQTGGEELLEEMRSLNVDRYGCWLISIVSDVQIQGYGNYLAQEYIDIETGESLGYVILKTTDIFEGMENEKSDRMIYLFDPTGNLIQSSDEEAIFLRDAIAMPEERRGYAAWLKENLENHSKTRQTINKVQISGGWEMISVTDMSRELSELNRSIITLLFASSLFAVFIYFVIYHIVKHIVQPIQMLSAHMLNSHGELPSPVDIPIRNDEAGILIAQFNEMADSNKELVHMLLEEKKEQEQLKLSLLQSQIKPHFLYNTLDAIYCLVIMGRNEEGSRMTKLLSDYYRHVLSKGMDCVPLFEEVRQTEKYLQIQEIRYSDMLEFSIQIGENVENIKIPKLTLQPLVENAIYHGIKPTGSKGHLQIKITQENWMVRIRVINDGIAFTREKFERSITAAQSSTDGFGLQNVVSRLKIYYQNRCRIELEDRKEGTSLLITIQTER